MTNNTPSVFFQMNCVHDPMHERSHNKGSRTDEQQARKKGIRRGKQLACMRLDRINRTHAAKNHRCVHKGIDPGQFSEEVVAQHADPEGNANRHRRQSNEPDDSQKEAGSGQERIGTVFEHARYRTDQKQYSESGGAV